MIEDDTFTIIIVVFGSISCLILVLIITIICKCCLCNREAQRDNTTPVNQNEALPMHQIVPCDHSDTICYNEQNQQNGNNEDTQSEQIFHIPHEHPRPEPSAPPLPPEYYIEYT